MLNSRRRECTRTCFVRRVRQMKAYKDKECSPVELPTVFDGLQILTTLGRVVVLEIWLDGLVLLVEEGQVGNEVLDDVHCMA